MQSSAPSDSSAAPQPHDAPATDALLARVVLAAADAIFCQDVGGAVLSWNPAAELLYGVTAAEMLGRVPDGLAAEGPRQQLASAQDRAGAGERVSRFDSWHLHRDGTPFAVAVSVISLRDDSDRIDAVATTVTDLRSVRCVMDDLLGCARFRHTPRADDRVDLRQVTADVKASLSRTIRELNGNVEIGPLPHVRHDVELLETLLQSLLSNALTFRSPGRPPQVIVTATQPDGWVTLRVDDNGIGILPGDRDRVFRVFQRLHGPEAGTGIGLAIARQIIELAGGRIWVDESPLGGARLSCTLPAAGDADSVHPRLAP